MATEIDIVNLALARVGVRDFIDSFTEETIEAQAASVAYALSRDALLVRHPWPWAVRRATLNLLTGVERSDWSYAFQVPNDCLQELHLSSNRIPSTVWAPPDIRRPKVPSLPYALELNDAADRRILLTDETEPELTYISRVTSTGLYHPLFVQALAWALAVEFVAVLPIKPELAARAAVQAETALQMAWVASMNSQQREPEPDPVFITSRE